MTNATFEKLRARLTEMARGALENASALEDQARTPLGGDAGGSLSNAPMHLGDLGTAVYMQELNTTLMENEQYIRDEVLDALGRVDRGVYGLCENCRAEIPEERLDALPYARHCTKCAAELGSGRPINLNDGRPGSAFGSASSDEWPNPAEAGHGPDPASFPELDEEPPTGDRGDTHGAGTPGGGTAVGGLAGTNIGDGDPGQADLNAAMGSGNFDVAVDADEDPDAPNAYGGPTGGAVGGTPANKRASGGKTRRGLAPRPDPGDSPTGP